MAVVRIEVGKTVIIPKGYRWGYEYHEGNVEFHVSPNGAKLPHSQGKTEYDQHWGVFRFDSRVSIFEVLEREDSQRLEDCSV